MTDHRFEFVLGRLGGGPRPLPDGADERIWDRIEEAATETASVTPPATAGVAPAAIVGFPENGGSPGSRRRRWARAAAAGVVAVATIVVAVVLWPGGDTETEIDPRDTVPQTSVPDAPGTSPAGSVPGVGVEPAVDQIAYLSPSAPVDGGGSKLAVVGPDGSGRVELDESWIWSPTWSADGRFLVFVCAAAEGTTTGSPSVICALNADGTGFTRLTGIPGTDDPTGWSPDRVDLDIQPTVSPDGTRVAFTTWRDAPGAAEGNPEVFVMEADGTDLTNLTRDPAGDGAPVWSPDGSRIAFVSDRGGDGFELYVMDADGGSVAGLGAWSNSVAWSPDGGRIVAAGDGDRGGFEGPVVVVTVETGAVRTIAERGSQMAWSPDGARIAYAVAAEDGTSQLTVIDAAGGDLVALADDGSFEASPTWSPDGTRLAYSSVDGIRVVDADGTDPVLVVAEPGASEPRWSPAVGGSEPEG